MATIEIETYYDRVRDALVGLSTETRDDLLEDLPDHLAEVLAEGDGSLRDRLGEPEDYAEELRAAAGVEPTAVPTAHGVHRVLERGLGRTTELMHRFDVQAGRLVGYPRLRDLLRAAAPGWWILRGWIVAQFICGTHNRSTWHGFVPRIGGNALAGLLCTIAAVALSVWIGRRTSGFTVWPRRIMAAASAVIAGWAVVVLLADNDGGGGSYPYGGPVDGNLTPYVSDVYVYDTNGNPVLGARLFDQDGNPIQVGNPYCMDGRPAAGTGPDGTAREWTYPLCPTSTGPFRSGPGALPATATGTPATTESTSPAPSDSATSSPTKAPSATPTAKARPTR